MTSRGNFDKVSNFDNCLLIFDQCLWHSTGALDFVLAKLSAPCRFHDCSRTALHHIVPVWYCRGWLPRFKTNARVTKSIATRQNQVRMCQFEVQKVHYLKLFKNIILYLIVIYINFGLLSNSRLETPLRHLLHRCNKHWYFHPGKTLNRIVSGQLQGVPKNVTILTACHSHNYCRKRLYFG